MVSVVVVVEKSLMEQLLRSMLFPTISQVKGNLMRSTSKLALTSKLMEIRPHLTDQTSTQLLKKSVSGALENQKGLKRYPTKGLKVIEDLMVS